LVFLIGSDIPPLIKAADERPIENLVDGGASCDHETDRYGPLLKCRRPISFSPPRGPPLAKNEIFSLAAVTYVTQQR
jgi:hypothetical protein